MTRLCVAFMYVGPATRWGLRVKKKEKVFVPSKSSNSAMKPKKPLNASEHSLITFVIFTQQKRIVYTV